VPLVEGLDGSFYGTTEYAGDFIYSGNVFGITREGVETMLFSFDYTDGRGMFDSGLDYGGIVQATDGYLYGATPGGRSRGDSSSGREPLRNHTVRRK
jgi:hypothetical protein